MKIAILSFYNGLVNRGVETWTREFADRMTKRGHSILVLQGGEETEKAYKKKVLAPNLNLDLRSGKSKLQHLASWFHEIFVMSVFSVQSIKHLKKFAPDFVMPANGKAQALIIRVVTKVYNWKMVIVGHAGIGAHDKWNLLMRPDLFISPSRRGARWAKGNIFAKGVKIKAIPHGIDLVKFRPGKSRLKIDLQEPVFLCVSSFDTFKRVPLAIKAVARLAKGSLLIVGGGLDSGYIRKLGNKLLGPKRFKIISSSPSDIPEYYKLAKVFTLPSNQFEAFGIVYLEALAANLPIVATKDELRQEIVGNAGILIDPNNTKTYAEALKKAMLKKWDKKPRRQAEKFSWKKIIKRYEKVLFELIS